MVTVLNNCREQQAPPEAAALDNAEKGVVPEDEASGLGHGLLGLYSANLEDVYRIYVQCPEWLSPAFSRILGPASHHFLCLAVPNP